MTPWRATTLGDLCAEGGGGIQTGPFGSQLHASDYVEVGTPVVMPQNIRDNYVDAAGIARISDAELERLERYELLPGDIVYSRRGDVERRALVRPENAGWLCGTGCLRVRLGDESSNDATFISYALGLKSTRAWIVRHAVGATMLNLNTSILSAVPLRVPGVDEQRAIAEVLGALDDKIAANTHLVSTSLQLANAQFVDAAAHSMLSDLTFADVADVGGGGTPKTKVEEYWGDEVNWATPTDVTALHGPYLRSTSRRITQAGLDNCSSALYPPGSILMTSRATIGAFAVAQKPMAVNQGFIVVNSKGDVPQWWLFHEMRRRVPEFVSHANGATFLELSRGKFKNFHIHLASSDIMQNFADTADALHRRAEAAERESASLADTRDALLPLLMSGRVTVNDAESVVEGVA